MTKIIPAICCGCQRHKLLFSKAGLCVDCVEDLSEMVGIVIDAYDPHCAARRCLIENLSLAWGESSISVEMLREAIFKAAQTNSPPQKTKRPTR